MTHVLKLAEKSNDPYLVALAAAGAANAKKDATPRSCWTRLAKLQAEDGHLEGEQGSITRSGGQSLQVETTALAALAWLKLPDFAPQANRAVKWMIASRQGSGGFGSTQATILALKALVEHSRANRKTVAAGKLIVRRDDMPIGEQAFDAGRQETIVVDGLEAELKPGSNRLDINLTGENKMPYALDVSLPHAEARERREMPGAAFDQLGQDPRQGRRDGRLDGRVGQRDRQGPADDDRAILGLPAGLEVRPDQLEELEEGRHDRLLRDPSARGDLLLALAGPEAEDRPETRPGGRRARPILGPGLAGVPLLHGRAEAVGRAASG